MLQLVLATATATVTTAATATLPADDDSARSMAFWVEEPLPTLHVPFPLGGHCTGNRRQRPGAAPRTPSVRAAEGEVGCGHGLAFPTRLHLLLQNKRGRLSVLAYA